MFSGIWDFLTTDRGPLNGHPYEIHVYPTSRIPGTESCSDVAENFPFQTIDCRDDQVSLFLWNVHTGSLLLH